MHTPFHNIVCVYFVSAVSTTGILEIQNISQFEFGEYQCNATNAVGFAVCTVELDHGVFVVSCC